MSFELDRLDRSILNILQLDSRISNQTLAERVGLSPPACLRRVRRLREEGVIMGEVALINPRMVGRNINIIVEVEMVRDQLDIYDAFKRKMDGAPEVTQCYQVTGEVDFLLMLMVEDMESYEAFTRKYLSTDANLSKFRTLISLRRDKFSTAIPL
ncbi:Lrp/AsnC family transcriptional regulator [Amphritea japonica]|uniref:Lrp/AsnC family transcriptional regulator, leucine-responsive regulatory protein n=1 Tax=Amphritea japonica ATCC BAA-1530 TaxID=1278309 RepID=A0A7R6P4J5_9GAMM|nr:Lrp/AsnC family transcriptional regulator [Amphritea japonica]BBB27183.1 Lrp/AsnC family transcriptional regulator, leucine-responsive regulatory protein [Amphritea japonica ATCC BAA-1530]